MPDDIGFQDCPTIRDEHVDVFDDVDEELVVAILYVGRTPRDLARGLYRNLLEFFDVLHLLVFNFASGDVLL